MSSNRRSYCIGDICSFSKGASVPKARMSNKGDWKYIHYGDLYKGFDFYIDIDRPSKPIPFVSFNEKAKSDQFVTTNDIIYVLTSETVDDLGHAYMVRNAGKEIILAGTETTVMRVDRTDLVVPAYCNYMLQTNRFKKLLRQYVTGMKVFRVHPRDISRIQIEVPSIEDQVKIVGLLDLFYEKIRLNHQTNDYLAA